MTSRPAGPQHALHLAQRLGPVVEEHQAELADHGVEGRVGKGQRLGAAFVPFDAGVLAPRDREHLRVDVQADDRAAGRDAFGHRGGQRAGAAGHVEHMLAGADLRRLAQQRAPLTKERGNESLLVHLGG